MKQSPRPAYWQLDLFVLTMLGLLIAAMMLGFPGQWETVVAIGWSGLMILGMSMWVYANWAALMEEERAQRRTHANDSQPQLSNHAVRNSSLSLVQPHVLDVTQVRERHNN